MYNIVILDDDKKQCELIASMVMQSACDAGEMYNIVILDSREKLNTLLERGYQIDILLADIFLENDDKTGIDAARRVLEHNAGTQIIYITGFVEYCTDVYETEHIYFLRKPVDKVSFGKALAKACDNLYEQERRTIVVNFAGKICRLKLHDIVYVESDKRKIFYHCKNNVYETYDKISNIVPLLGGEFVQCHKSYLVNMRYIKELKKDALLLSNGCEIMISRNRYNETKEQFLDYVSVI